LKIAMNWNVLPVITVMRCKAIILPSLCRGMILVCGTGNLLVPTGVQPGVMFKYRARSEKIRLMVLR